MSKISVIVAAYNAEKYIERCIRSILSQHADMEVVVVDDGSADRTRAILEGYGDSIRLIALAKNGGSAAAARNIGLAAATGDLIAFCDADDWYPPGALDRVVQLQYETNADIVRFSYDVVLPDGRTRIMKEGVFPDSLVEKKEFPKKIYPYFINGIGLNSVWGAVFQRQMIADMRFPPDFLTAEDAVFAMEAYTRANSVLLCSEPLYHYYRHSVSLTGTGMGVLQKYRYNFRLARRMLTYLPRWDMDTPIWRLRTLARPIKITAGKVKRLIQYKERRKQ